MTGEKVHEVFLQFLDTDGKRLFQQTVSQTSCLFLKFNSLFNDRGLELIPFCTQSSQRSAGDVGQWCRNTVAALATAT